MSEVSETSHQVENDAEGRGINPHGSDESAVFVFLRRDVSKVCRSEGWGVVCPKHCRRGCWFSTDQRDPHWNLR